MPTQSADIFNMNTPGIEYAGPGITWKIAKGVSVGSQNSQGMLSTHVNSKLVNKGTVHSTNNYGAWLQQSDTEIQNTNPGQIVGNLVGLFLGGVTTIQNVEAHNDGDIAAASYGILAQFISHLILYNTGEVFSPSFAIVIQAPTALPKGSKIDNDGDIEGGQYAIISQLHATNTMKVVNREDGVIEGGLASIVAASGKLKVTNEGKIVGDIVSGTSDDKVINKGKVKGDTYVGPGNDTIKNKDGKAQMLFGQEGNDKFIAGANKDRIVFDTTLNAITNVDTVKNFAPGKDQFYLDMTIFASLTGPGPLLANQFRKGNAAVDGDDYIVYHKGSGSLFYDPDGSGATAQTKFAEVDPGTKLSHNDFTVIA